MHDGFKAISEYLPCEPTLFEVSGRPAYLLKPRLSPGRLVPWVWYAPTFQDGNPRQENEWMFRRFLERGIAVAGVDVGESYGNPAGRKVFGAFHDLLVRTHGMAERPVLLPQSRGGLMHYNWAAEKADKVAAVAGIFPVCDLGSYPGIKAACGAYGMTADELAAHLDEHNPVSRLAPLAHEHVPVLHVHGDSDTLVPLDANSGELERRYRALGGQVEIIVVHRKGHEVAPDFFECERLTEFATEWALRSI